MSTSEREFATLPTAESLGAHGVPQGSPLGAPGLPDVGLLTQLANEFFRTLPGVGVAPNSEHAVQRAVSAVNLEARPPQFGVPVPSVPAAQATPSQVAVPVVADAGRFGGGPSVSPAGFGDGVSGVSLPGSAAVSSVSPVQSPSPSLPGFAGVGLSSPFGLPLPAFETGFPTFGVAVPAIPPLPGLLSENEARQAIELSSPFYFLQHAGALSGELPGTESTAGKQGSQAGIPQGFQPVLQAAAYSRGLPDLGLSRGLFDVDSIRRDFPILREEVNGRPLIWLDNAATTQKPQAVIDRLSYFYEHENSNIHRAAHELAARATDAYEDAREKVREFLNAGTTQEIVFVRGATEAINLVAQGWGRRHIQAGDEIVVSQIEHHANIVPWQMLCSEKGARLRVIPVDDDGQILLDEYEKLLNSKTKLVSVTQVSNALGTITPAKQIVEMAHRYGAKALVDGAQAVSHMRVDVQSLDCDFYVFSGHKVFAPTGIGVLFGKADVLADTPPWQGGGNMIVDVTFEKTIYQPPPMRFEAGTGNIADAVGLGAAIDYLNHIGMENIERYEHDLLVYATRQMLTIPKLRLIGTAKEKAGVLSFVLDGFKTEEVGVALNKEGIAVRSGHHCAQPTLRRYGLETTVRPSLALYNTCGEIDVMVDALRRLTHSRV